jgi:hypothetical protein
MGLSVAVAIPVLLLLTSMRTLDQGFVAVGLFLFMTCTANALVPTMLQDLAPASLRARCFAIWSFVVSLFGASGPLIAGTLSDWFFDKHLLNAIAAVAVPALAVSMGCALWSVLRIRRERAPTESWPA